MSYIGNTNTTQAFTPAVDFFNGNGSTTAFTLSKPVASVAQVQAVISNVPQTPGTAYTVSGNTITFTSAPPSGTSNIYVYYTSPITQVIAPGQGTVTTTSLMDGSVTTAKIADGAVTPAKLSTGAPTWDTNGNLAVAGITLNSWYSNRKAIQTGLGVAVAGSLSSVDYGFFGTNYYDAASGGTSTYIGSGKAARYEQSAGVHAWSTAGTGTAGGTISWTQGMTLNTSSNLLLVGGIALGNVSYTDGIGVKFPAAQVASTDANTLDDYEEGTWTPALGGITTVNYSDGPFGTYVKVGRVVTLWWDFTVSSYSGGSWNSRITGLPFTVSSSQAGYSSGVSRDSGLFNSGLSTGYQLKFFAQKADVYLACQVDNSGASGFSTANTNAPITTSGRCTGTITYYASS